MAAAMEERNGVLPNGGGPVVIREPRILGCVPIRRAVLVIGMLEFALIGIQFSGCAYILYAYDQLSKTVMNEKDVVGGRQITTDPLDKYMIYGQMAMNALQILVVLCLLYGVATFQANMLLPHFAVQVANIALLVARSVCIILVYGFRPFAFYNLGSFVLSVILFCYFTYVVWVCYEFIGVVQKILKQQTGMNGP